MYVVSKEWIINVRVVRIQRPRTHVQAQQSCVLLGGKRRSRHLRKGPHRDVRPRAFFPAPSMSQGTESRQVGHQDTSRASSSNVMDASCVIRLHTWKFLICTTNPSWSNPIPDALHLPTRYFIKKYIIWCQNTLFGVKVYYLIKREIISCKSMLFDTKVC